MFSENKIRTIDRSPQWLIPESPLSGNRYNLHYVLKKDFQLNKAPFSVEASIAADTYYRLEINGHWVADGPSRAAEAELIYDTHEVSHLLKKGKNQICVLVRFYGSGTMHQRPKEPGVAFELKETDGTQILTSDLSWKCALAEGWLRHTPKISVQMPPYEHYVASNTTDTPVSMIAKELPEGYKVIKREIPLLRHRNIPIRQISQAISLPSAQASHLVPITPLLHPNKLGINHFKSREIALTTVLTTDVATQVTFPLQDWICYLDGNLIQPGISTIEPGAHTLSYFVKTYYTHLPEENFAEPKGQIQLRHPLKPGSVNHWCSLHLPEAHYYDDDIPSWDFPSTQAETAKQRYYNAAKSLHSKLSSHSIELAPWVELATNQGELFWPDVAQDYLQRPVKPLVKMLDGFHDIDLPLKLQSGDDTDTEIIIDLGGQHCGYIEFELSAAAGSILDFYMVEYISDTGVIQHTIMQEAGETKYINRNGLRYETTSGQQHYRSLRRRSGRYLIIHLRAGLKQIEISALRFIEATYPTDIQASFKASNPRFNQIWQCSQRTLELCMEDVFTDCPLYEQTLWIGDSRNEALYAYPVFGASDLAQRCLRLGANSLKNYPLVQSQTPSGWGSIIPAWSFLWVIMAWENYEQTADLEFTQSILPAVLKMLDNCENYRNEDGLFSGPFWNFFDWAPIESKHECVLHNSLFWLGALLATHRICNTVKSSSTAIIESRIKCTREAICKQFDANAGTYPDAIDANGHTVRHYSQHNAALAIIYGAFNNLTQKQQLIEALTNPPAEHATFGSPFALQFYFEALDKLGRREMIYREMMVRYNPMIEAGSDTLWETYANSEFSPPGFPTRSHCHAWAASPLLYLPRVLLGIEEIGIGRRQFKLSPFIPNDLDSASGHLRCHGGTVNVEWTKTPNNQITLISRAPNNVKIEFISNSSLASFNVNYTHLTINTEAEILV
ncbi:family 78 glycoside hydrolase catalytic domain [Coraliomargarita sp. W4R72]